MTIATSTNLMQASQQWRSRPDDQRFPTLEALKQSVLQRKNESWTATPAVKDLRVVLPDSGPLAGELLIDAYDGTHGEHRQLMPTNYAFNQLAQYAGAPAAYLRKMPEQLAAINLQWGLENIAQRDDALLLAQSNGENKLRAMTSTSYGRIWDLDVVEAVEAVNQDGRWRIPAASYAARNPIRATTLYASDRDVFIFLVDDKNEVTVPTGDGREKQMFRGFFTWNSEVGAATFGLTTFLYDFVCDNRIIWGATDVKEVRIRHTGGAPERFAYEGQKYLKRYAEESTVKLIAGVKAAQAADIPLNAGTGETVENWLQKRGFTKAAAVGSVSAAKAEEGKAKSVWDIVNGITAYARSIPHTNERVELETKAGKLMEAVAA